MRFEDTPPDVSTAHNPHAITAVLEGKSRDLGGLVVRRVLPAITPRAIGPFVFFDHMGPAVFGPGEGIDVRPHPHIGLATVTYLFEGEIVHRDSLGSHQPIRPGDVNWMQAGRGIVHSERTDAARRAGGARLHGLQLWVALPLHAEEAEPAFHHHPSATLPELERDGVRLKVLAGGGYGARSPLLTASPLVYVDAQLPEGATLHVDVEAVERGVYVVEGEVRCGEVLARPGQMMVLAPDAEVVLMATEATRLVILGGDPLDAPRHLRWNFVSSSEGRIDQAVEDWEAGRFAAVPGETEFIPYPDVLKKGAR